MGDAERLREPRFNVDEHYILIVTCKDRDHSHAHGVACRVSIERYGPRSPRLARRPTVRPRTATSERGPQARSAVEAAAGAEPRCRPGGSAGVDPQRLERPLPAVPRPGSEAGRAASGCTPDRPLDRGREATASRRGRRRPARRDRTSTTGAAGRREPAYDPARRLQRRDGSPAVDRQDEDGKCRTVRGHLPTAPVEPT